MVNVDIPEHLKRLEIPGRVTLLEGSGDLPKLEVNSDWSCAEIYLHGAHVTDFQKKGEEPILFSSQFSRFSSNQSIRGGIPIIFPWFGAREGEQMHGFARLAEWDLHEAITIPEGGVTLRFSLVEPVDTATWPPFAANYVVTVADKLTLELIVTNRSSNQPFSFEACLHSYFFVGDINKVAISGLKGISYLDKVDNYAQKTETAETLQIASEVDRVYFDTQGPVEILDNQLQRRIRIEKAGSASTVVWNPWIAKSQQMPDFGDDEYLHMVCVESGNVGKNKIILAAGKSTSLKAVISSKPL